MTQAELTRSDELLSCAEEGERAGVQMSEENSPENAVETEGVAEAENEVEAKPSLSEEGQSEETTSPVVDYEALANEDLALLKGEFSELGALTSLFELENPERYGELRDLGLSPREAYLATATPKREKVTPYDNRSHLHSSVPRSHGGRVDAMSVGELREARELFAGMSDAEIVRLYKKVNS